MTPDELRALAEALERMAQQGKVPVNYDQLCGLAYHARRVGTLDVFADVALQWAGQADKEIERLTAALHAQPGPVSLDDVEWAGKVHLAEAIRERDELRRQLDDAEQDARRYRDWLRGGANIPPESTRWPRWEVRYWNGRHWITLFAEQMDAAIDAAMGASNE